MKASCTVHADTPMPTRAEVAYLCEALPWLAATTRADTRNAALAEECITRTAWQGEEALTIEGSFQADGVGCFRFRVCMARGESGTSTAYTTWPADR